MRGGSSAFRRLVPLVGVFVLSACASYSGSNLKAGVSTLDEVVASMGEPAMRWKDADGQEQLAYPRGPVGTQTFMAFIGANGRLERIEPVLNNAHFARIEPGKSDKVSILRLLGPSQPQWTVYYQARDEVDWEWRYCDSLNLTAFFGVAFDATTWVVRSTYSRPDYEWPRGVVPTCGQTPPSMLPGFVPGSPDN
jgi:hypothetical protein